MKTTTLQRSLFPTQSGQTCYLVPDAFSRAECDSWIEATEARGYAPTGGSYPAAYRNNDRLLFDDPVLAATLFARLESELPPELDLGGERWRLVGLNPRFRCCRYEGGQRFTIHRDGPYAPATDQRSWLTVMLYLNGEGAFAGGATTFYADRSGADELAAVAPAAGTLVVFSHDLWHAGEAVTAGRKYVLRSDVLYQRVPTREPEGSRPAGPRIPGALKVLRGHQSYVWSVIALSQGGLASAGRDGTIRIWSASGEALQVLRGPWRSVTALAEGGPGQLWAGHRDGLLQRFELSSGAASATIQPETPGPILALAPRPEGGVVVAESSGWVTWRDGEGAILSRARAHEGWVWALTRTSTGWASGGEDGVIRRWSEEGEPESPQAEITRLESPIRALADLGKGQLAIGGATGQVWLQEPGSPLRHIGSHRGIVRALLPLPKGLLASGGEDDRIRFWSLSGGENEESSHAHADFVTALALVGPASRARLASASYDGTLALWRLPSS